MAAELVGPTKRSFGVGCMVKAGRPPKHNCYYTRTFMIYPQDPVCICPCHGGRMNDDEVIGWGDLVDPGLLPDWARLDSVC